MAKGSLKLLILNPIVFEEVIMKTTIEVPKAALVELARLSMSICQRLFDAGLDTREVSRVLEIIEKTCSHCCNANVGCQCNNDE